MSTTLGYILALSITTVLVSGLLIGVGGFVDDQRERVVRVELEVVGQQLAAELASVDRLVQGGGTGTTHASSEVALPSTIGGTAYSVVVVPDGTGNASLRLEAVDPAVRVTVGLTNTTAIRTDDPVRGGDLAIEYDPGTGRLEVRQADV